VLDLISAGATSVILALHSNDVAAEGLAPSAVLEEKKEKEKKSKKQSEEALRATRQATNITAQASERVRLMREGMPGGNAPSPFPNPMRPNVGGGGGRFNSGMINVNGMMVAQQVPGGEGGRARRAERKEKESKEKEGGEDVEKAIQLHSLDDLTPEQRALIQSVPVVAVSSLFASSLRALLHGQERSDPVRLHRTALMKQLETLGFQNKVHNSKALRKSNWILDKAVSWLDSNRQWLENSQQMADSDGDGMEEEAELGAPTGVADTQEGSAGGAEVKEEEEEAEEHADGEDEEHESENARVGASSSGPSVSLGTSAQTGSFGSSPGGLAGAPSQGFGGFGQARPQSFGATPAAPTGFNFGGMSSAPTGLTQHPPSASAGFAFGSSPSNSSFGSSNFGAPAAGFGRGGFGSSGAAPSQPSLFGSTAPSQSFAAPASGFGHAVGAPASTGAPSSAAASASASTTIAVGSEEHKENGSGGDRQTVVAQKSPEQEKLDLQAAAEKEKLEAQKSPEQRAHEAAEAAEKAKMAGAGRSAGQDSQPDGAGGAPSSGAPSNSERGFGRVSAHEAGGDSSEHSARAAAAAAPSRQLEHAWASFSEQPTASNAMAALLQQQQQMVQMQQQQSLFGQSAFSFSQPQQGFGRGFGTSSGFGQPMMSSPFPGLPPPPPAATKRLGHSSSAKESQRNGGQELLLASGCSIESIQTSETFKVQVTHALTAALELRSSSTSALLSALNNLQHRLLVAYARNILRNVLASWPSSMSVRDFAPPCLLAPTLHVAMALDGQAHIAAEVNPEQYLEGYDFRRTLLRALKDDATREKDAGYLRSSLMANITDVLQSSADAASRGRVSVQVNSRLLSQPEATPTPITFTQRSMPKSTLPVSEWKDTLVTSSSECTLVRVESADAKALVLAIDASMLTDAQHSVDVTFYDADRVERRRVRLHSKNDECSRIKVLMHGSSAFYSIGAVNQLATGHNLQKPLVLTVKVSTV
jgi:hypothetical protein